MKLDVEVRIDQVTVNVYGPDRDKARIDAEEIAPAVAGLVDEELGKRSHAERRGF